MLVKAISIWKAGRTKSIHRLRSVRTTLASFLKAFTVHAVGALSLLFSHPEIRLSKHLFFFFSCVPSILCIKVLSYDIFPSQYIEAFEEQWMQAHTWWRRYTQPNWYIFSVCLSGDLPLKFSFTQTMQKTVDKRYSALRMHTIQHKRNRMNSLFVTVPFVNGFVLL